MLIAGIDPGMSGAIALVDASAPKMIVIVHDMPTLQLGKTRRKRSLDYHELVSILSYAHRVQGGIGHAWVEQTWNRPGEGRSGALVGCYMAILATLTAIGIPWTAVSPQAWKKSLTVPAAKDGARARASQLLPEYAGLWSRAKDDGRAEAALLAHYGIRTLNGIAGRQ